MPTWTMRDWKPSRQKKKNSRREGESALLFSRLEQTRAELIDERAKSTDEKIFTETELANLRSR